VASSTFHLTTSSNRHVGITECRKLKCRIWRSDLWHNVHTIFHEYPPSHFLVIKYVQTGHCVLDVGLDWVRLGYVRLAHAQIINTGVTDVHLTNSSNRYVGITECRKLKCIILRSYLRHNVHTKFREYPSSHSLVIKCVKDITYVVGLG
jgi:hypothetical protein